MNEVSVIRHAAADVDAYRASTEAADMCKAIVVATSSNIQGRKYVAVEGWQALATAHGCTLGARDVERVEGGVRAIGEVRRMSDGQLIVTAEGFVGEDEPTWYGGDSRGRKLPKRADYAIRAMAQTRAMSRAGRSAFAHVVVMMNAGLATTPAEEMVTIDGETGEILDSANGHRDPTIPGITKIRNNLNKLRRDGGKATDLETFNALVSANKDDLAKIRDAHHTLWTGMGEDFDGFNRWIRTRRDELTPKQESTAFQLLASLVGECKTTGELASFLDEYESQIADLDGEEGRRFDTLYNEREEALKADLPDDMTRAYTQEELRQAARGTTPLEAGAFGG